MTEKGKETHFKEDQEWVPDDDRVIAVALRRSLTILGLVVVAVAIAFWWGHRVTPETPVAEVKQAAPASLSDTEMPEPPKIQFKDITKEAGIDFVQENGAYGLKLLPEALGSGAAFADFDNDGDPDLLLVNGDLWPWHDYPPDRKRPTQHIYLNDGTGHFTDITQGSGLDVSFYGTAPAVGDYDGDGLDDIFIAAVGGNHLFHNLGGGRFAEVTDSAGIAGDPDAWSSCAAFFDADGDSDLDLFVCNYVQWSKQTDLDVDYRLTGIGRAYGPPKNYAGTNSYLYRNNGDGTFTDISKPAGIQITNPDTGQPEGKALAVRPAYIDQDNKLDLIVSNDTVRNFVFLNRGDAFVEQSLQTGLAFDPDGHATGAMGIDTAFIGDNGPRAIAIGNFSGEMTSFYLSQNDATLFADQSATSGVGPPSRLALSFGLFFFDADLDGRPDMFQTNGHLEQEINKVSPSQRYSQPSQLFWNCGHTCPRRFIVARAGDLNKSIVGRSATYADIDGDGDQDVLVTQVAKPPLLFRNNNQMDNQWIEIHLRQSGPNPRAIGSRLLVTTAVNQQEDLIMPTRSYQAQTTPDATFGFTSSSHGDNISVDITVLWPDGTRDVYNIRHANRDVLLTKTRQE